MAALRYNDFDDYAARLHADPPTKRRSFLMQVRFASIDIMTGENLDREYVLSAGCAIAWGWIGRVVCPSCNTRFALGKISRHVVDGRERYVSMLKLCEGDNFPWR